MAALKLSSCITYFVLLSFCGALFSSYATPEQITINLGLADLNIWFRDNWAVIALILSETAALLPGKPKGIIHAILKVGSSVYQKLVVSPKNLPS